jgi:alkylation response protein AidB-like acyl-CoA dehydrogenase
VEFGGRGLPARYQQVFNEEAAGFHVTSRVVGIGLGMCGPAILAHGTEQQKRRYIPPLLRGDEIWCQLFSEPSAGSDIAGVRTRVTTTDDGFVVDGQKVWSSVAHHADFGLLLGRSNTEVPKHAGMTMLIVPMNAPGVEIRPLKQMDGGANFNEVFLSDVRLTADSLVGEINGGWAVARTTLSNERVATAGGRQGNTSVVAPLLKQVPQLGGVSDPILRDALVRLYTWDRILQDLQAKVRVARERGLPPGPEGSVAKLLNSRLRKGVADVRMRLVGTRAVAWEDGDTLAATTARDVLSAPAVSIGGGTDEVQRNIIGERILGLQREPSIEKGRPFRDLPRG